MRSLLLLSSSGFHMIKIQRDSLKTFLRKYIPFLLGTVSNLLCLCSTLWKTTLTNYVKVFKDIYYRAWIVIHVTSERPRFQIFPHSTRISHTSAFHVTYCTNIMFEETHLHVLIHIIILLIQHQAVLDVFHVL